MPHATAPKVLVVDDDWSVVTLVEVQLTQVGYDVITCLDPMDALTRCETDDIGVFVSDFMMPGFTGLELLEILQQKHPRVRRLLLTAAPHEPEVQAGVRSGLVEQLVEKPWGRGELIASVRGLLASSALR